MPPACGHLDQIKITQTDKHYCEDCIKTGDPWLHCACASRAATWVAAILRRTSTRPSTFARRTIPLCDPSNRVKPGSGVTSTRSCRASSPPETLQIARTRSRRIAERLRRKGEDASERAA
jgi:hypothetical protein